MYWFKICLGHWTVECFIEECTEGLSVFMSPRTGCRGEDKRESCSQYLCLHARAAGVRIRESRAVAAWLWSSLYMVEFYFMEHLALVEHSVVIHSNVWYLTTRLLLTGSLFEGPVLLPRKGSPTLSASPQRPVKAGGSGMTSPNAFRLDGR